MHGAQIQRYGQGTRFHMPQLRPSTAKFKKQTKNTWMGARKIKCPKQQQHPKNETIATTLGETELWAPVPNQTHDVMIHHSLCSKGSCCVHPGDIWIPGWAWPCPHHSSPWYPSWLLSVPTRNTQACLNASPSHTSLGHVTCWSCLTAWQSAVQLCMSLALPSLISGYTENWALSFVPIIF